MLRTLSHSHSAFATYVLQLPSYKPQHQLDVKDYSLGKAF